MSRALWAAYGGQPRGFGTVREVPGAGVEAETEEGIWRLGNRRFACSGAAIDTSDTPYSEVVLSLDGRERSTFLFEDILRPRARSSIDALKKVGLELGILSGDRAPVVAKLAADIGIDNWRAGLSPATRPKPAPTPQHEGVAC